jgi:hypothetical protein
MFGLAEADDIALLMMISVLSVLILLTILERFKKSYRQTNFIDQHPKVRVFELFTKQSLASYTGSVDDLPIFVAVCGKVFDVSR